MAVNGSEPDGQAERLYEVLLDYLESSERGVRVGSAEMLARHPEFAPELQEFLETHVRLEGLTAPVRFMSQALFQSAGGKGLTVRDEGIATVAGVPSAETRYVGEYEILAEIGRGGMGVVYKARDRRLGRLVAVKMIRSAAHASKAEVARFLAEARAKARLDHPDIVPVYEVGQHDGLPYLIMAFIEGESLQERLTRGPLPTSEATRLVRRVAEAIQHAHGRGVLHRDLKPQNILLQYDSGNPPRSNDSRTGGSGSGTYSRDPSAVQPVPKVSDFGLARLTGDDGLTASGEILGTPGYMPPEQAAGRAKDVGPHSDVYSLGAVLYCLLTGRAPFQAADIAETLRQVKEQEPVPPRRLNAAVPRALETICLKALEKSPRRRYPSAAALADDLRRYEQGLPILAMRAGPLTHTVKWMRRRPAIASLLAMCLLLTVVGCASFVWAYSRALREAERARRESVRADAEAVVARHQAQEAQFGLYVSQIGRAQAQLLASDQPAAARVLEQTRPILRGWEYGYLRRCSQGTPLILRSPGGSVHAVAFSPDGTRLVTGCADASVRFWDTRSGRELLVLRGHGSPVTAVACSPDGSSVASASQDGTARVLAYPSGKLLFQLRRHTKSVNAICYAADGARLATASGDQTACIWDAHSGRLLLTLGTLDSALNAVAFSSDGKRLATSSNDNEVQVWDSATGSKLLAFTTRGVERAVTYSPDGARLAAASADGETKIWDGRGGQEVLATRRPTAANALAYSPDATRLATAYADGTVQLWDARSGAELITLRGHGGPIDAVAFAPEGMRLATGSRDETARIWDLTTGGPALEFRGHTGPLSTAIFSADGSRLVTASRDKTARVWDVRTQRQLLVLDHPGTVFSAAYSPDGERLATGAQDARARIWDAQSGQELLVLSGHNGSIESVDFSPDGTRLATGSDDRTAKIWNLRTGAEIRVLAGHTGPVRAVAYSPDGTRLATASDDRTVRIWEARTGEQLLELAGHGAVVDAVVFSRDGSRLATGSWDKTACVWDTHTGALTMVFRGHAHAVTDVSFTPDGTRLATGSWDKTARVWDVATGQELVALRGHADKVSSAIFSPDGTLLATASHDRTARVWDSRTGADLSAESEAVAVNDNTAAGVARADRHPQSRMPSGSGYDPWTEASVRLRSRAPGWHAGRIAATEADGDNFAAAFHLGRLLLLLPLDARLHARRADVLEKLGRTDGAAAHRCAAWLISQLRIPQDAGRAEPQVEHRHASAPGKRPGS